MGIILMFLPICIAIISAILPNKKLVYLINILFAFLELVLSIILTSQIIKYSTISYNVLNGIFYFDSLSIIMIDIVVIISFFVQIYLISYLEFEIKHGKIPESKVKLFYILLNIFIFTMLLTLSVSNFGLMWIAIEGTTLSSAFLVGFYNEKQSIEAAWKYIIICSVGIAIAFIGIVFLYLSSIEFISSQIQVLDWRILVEHAKSLNTSVLKISFIFILIGFGTKVGLSPMHTWLPDAHSQSPSPISALLSGVLLNSAFYCIIRCYSILNLNIGDSIFSGRILIAFGFLSVLTSAIFILTQKDYKRLLAYSSIEHMGLIAIGFGIFTKISVLGAILHMINHSFTKSTLFLCSGNILQKYNSRDIFKIHDLLKKLPVTGPIFFIGLFAIAGSPPFSIFSSELNIIISIFKNQNPYLGVLIVVLLAIIFSGISYNLYKIFYYKKSELVIEKGENNKLGLVSLLALLVFVVLFGLFIPSPIMILIKNTQNIILGGVS